MRKSEINPDDSLTLLKKQIGVLEKIGDRYKDMEVIISEAREYAENIIETVREPLIVMDGELKILSANKAFFTTFKVTPKETIGDYIYKLGNGQWNIPGLRKELKEVISNKNVLVDFRIEHKFETIGEKIMILNARRVPPTPARPRIILLAIEDVTDRVTKEEKITGGLKGEVEDKTSELEKSNRLLRAKIAEMEIFNKAAVGRELTLRKLKKEAEELKKRLGEK